MSDADKTYRVDFSIDVEAAGPIEACRQAWHSMAFGSGYPVGEVREHNTVDSVYVDLDAIAEGSDGSFSDNDRGEIIPDDKYAKTWVLYVNIEGAEVWRRFDQEQSFLEYLEERVAEANPGIWVDNEFSADFVVDFKDRLRGTFLWTSF